MAEELDIASAVDVEALQRAQDEDGTGDETMDAAGLGGPKGTGPRLFCGHVPKEVNDEMVRQHFSKWGNVSDVYFPRHKKTLKRRPFCFVTFVTREDAERALAGSGLDICGVAIKNLTMVEDRDKYYTNKHATARQALLQALKQLGPSAAAPAPAGGALPLTAAAGAAACVGGSSSSPDHLTSPDHLSSLAAIMALEGVPSEVVLQTLAAAAAAEGGQRAGGASLDSSSLLHALASPSLSSHTAYDMRSSLDLSMSNAMRSARESMDIASLHQGLAAGGRLPFGGSHHMHTSDSCSTLASADWSNAPSARASLDASLLPAATTGFLASGGGSFSGLQTRLSLDAALQLHQVQQAAAQQAQQHAAMLANSARMAAGQQQHAYQPLGRPAPAAPQQNLTAVMHSGFYQPAPPQPDQHSLQTVMGSGFYGGPSAAPAPVPAVRHSMHEFGARGGGGGGGGLLPYGDPAWAAHQQAQHHQQAQQLGGYSTSLRPSIDRGGLPPLAPRSPNQDMMGRQAPSASMDGITGLTTAAANGGGGGWPLHSPRMQG